MYLQDVSLLKQLLQLYGHNPWTEQAVSDAHTIAHSSGCVCCVNVYDIPVEVNWNLMASIWGQTLGKSSSWVTTDLMVVNWWRRNALLVTHEALITDMEVQNLTPEVNCFCRNIIVFHVHTSMMVHVSSASRNSGFVLQLQMLDTV